MKTSTFAFDLPENLIAQAPLASREASRLLLAQVGESRCAGSISDRLFVDLPEILWKMRSPGGEGPLLVRNISRVFPARVRVRRNSGARGEVLILETGERSDYACLLRPLKKLRVGEVLLSDASGEAVFRVVSLDPPRVSPVEGSLAYLLEVHGEMPLPPYIVRDPNRVGDMYRSLDRERYQTVYGREVGSAAAPTAGLHFTEEIVTACENVGCSFADVTLHVGLGTFLPVQADVVEKHVMHEELYQVGIGTCLTLLKALQTGRPVIYVGTTSLRTVESFMRRVLPAEVITPGKSLAPKVWHRDDVVESLTRAADDWFSTNLFIRPLDLHGSRIEPLAGNALLTNFHQPESTLVMLVAALLGFDFWNKVYSHALEKKYRFLSYGDSSLLSWWKGDLPDAV